MQVRGWGKWLCVTTQYSHMYCTCIVAIMPSKDKIVQQLLMAIDLYGCLYGRLAHVCTFIYTNKRHKFCTKCVQCSAKISNYLKERSPQLLLYNCTSALVLAKQKGFWSTSLHVNQQNPILLKRCLGFVCIHTHMLSTAAQSKALYQTLVIKVHINSSFPFTHQQLLKFCGRQTRALCTSMQWGFNCRKQWVKRPYSELLTVMEGYGLFWSMILKLLHTCPHWSSCTQW